MSSLYQQAHTLIADSQRILLIAHIKMDGDTLSATIAMHLLLRQLHKETVVACGDAVPEEFSFLPETGVMRREISSGNDFVISVDCSQVHAQKLRWKMEGDHLKIFVTPSDGAFSQQNVSFFEHSDFDLIISLDAADKKQLGSIYTDNTDLFSRVPLLVFDHHASNVGFGNVNIIDTKSASTTEVLYHFLPTLFGSDWEKKITPDIATLLLTGIITDTGSFQNANTTPKSLEVAANLVELGARQQEIIRKIYKTKNIQTLKLWGRVLSKINTDPIHRMLWSTVSAHDLLDTGGLSEDTGGIIDELLATAPGMEMVILLKERPDGMVSVSVRTTTALCDASQFAADFGGGGHTQAAGFKIRGNKPFDIVVGEIISAAQEFQSNRLGIADHQEKMSQNPPSDPAMLSQKKEQLQESKQSQQKEQEKKYAQEETEEEKQAALQEPHQSERKNQKSPQYSQNQKQKKNIQKKNTQNILKNTQEQKDVQKQKQKQKREQEGQQKQGEEGKSKQGQKSRQNSVLFPTEKSFSDQEFSGLLEKIMKSDPSTLKKNTSKT